MFAQGHRERFLIFQRLSDFKVAASGLREHFHNCVGVVAAIAAASGV